jgi:hypothetical protein
MGADNLEIARHQRVRMPVDRLAYRREQDLACLGNLAAEDNAGGVECVGERRDGRPDRPACARQYVRRGRVAELCRQPDIGDCQGFAGGECSGEPRAAPLRHGQAGISQQCLDACHRFEAPDIAASTDDPGTLPDTDMPELAGDAERAAVEPAPGDQARIDLATEVDEHHVIAPL